MKVRSIRRSLAAIGCVVAVLSGTAAHADEIRVSGGECAGTVRLVAHDAPLSTVLKRLAHSLDFQVSYESESDPLVNVNASREPVDLLALLAPSENISITQARNPRCPSRDRIVKVWVLSKGQKNLARAALTPQVEANAAEQARKEKEGAAMILQAHGLPVPSEQNPDNPENPETN